MQHDEVEAQNSGTAFSEDLQEIHENFLWVKDAIDEFIADHEKGVVRRDNATARRRARTLSIELGKRLKDYRAVSNSVDSERRRRRSEARSESE